MSASHQLVSGCFRTSDSRSDSSTMKLVVLAILVGIVLSTSSFDSDHEIGTSMEIPDSTPRGVLKKNGTAGRKSGRRVRFNSTCKWSEFNLQQFKEISNSSLRIFLQIKLGGIGSTDCILFYRVENNDGESPYYPFRIDRQTRYSRSSIYGIVGVDDDGNFKWEASYRNKFEHYLAWCDSKNGAEDEHPQVPRDLSCRQTLITPTTPPSLVIPTTSAKGVIHPLEETFTTVPQVTPSREVVSTTLSTPAIPTTSAKGVVPPLEETTTPAPQVTPSREVVFTTLSTPAIPTTSAKEVVPPLEETTTPASQVTPSQEVVPTTLPTPAIPATSTTGIIPSLEETTAPAPRVTPSREVVATTLSTRAISTQKITPTTVSPIPPRGVTSEKSAKKTRKGWIKKFLKSLNCFSCVEE